MRTKVSVLTIIATLAWCSPKVFSDEPAPSRAGLTPAARQKLWGMTELRKVPLRPEKISSRLVPLVVPNAGDFKSNGDRSAAKAKRAPDGFQDRPATSAEELLVEEYYYNSGTAPQGPNRIYAAIARPEGARGRVPVVMVFHGGGGHASPAMALAIARRHPGMASFAMDYNGQFAPGAGNVTHWKYAGSGRKLDLSPDLRNHPQYHHVVAARRGIDFLESQPWADTSRIGCFGVSAGGWLALILAGVDDRVRAVTTAVSAGGALGTAGRSAQTLRWEPAEQRSLWLAAYEPMAYAAETRAAIFFQLATNDIFFWLSGAERNIAALAGKTGWVLRPNCNHNVGGPDMPDTSPAAWMAYVLNNDPALPVIRQLASGPDRRTYTWNVDGPEPIANAVLNWSPGKAVSPARYWVEFPAERTGDRWTARVPQALCALSADVFATAFEHRRGAVSSTIIHQNGLDPRTTAGPLWEGGTLWDASRGTAAWRMPGAGSPATQFKVVNRGNLEVGPAKGGREFAVLTNSVVLASGVASHYRGLRLRINGNGQAGALKVRLSRDSGSMDEVSFETEVAYEAETTAYEIPWVNFQAAVPGAAPPWPFDGLLVGGQRGDGSPLVIETIELWAPALPPATPRLR